MTPGLNARDYRIRSHGESMVVDCLTTVGRRRACLQSLSIPRIHAGRRSYARRHRRFFMR